LIERQAGQKGEPEGEDKLSPEQAGEGPPKAGGGIRVEVDVNGGGPGRAQRVTKLIDVREKERLIAASNGLWGIDDLPPREERLYQKEQHQYAGNQRSDVHHENDARGMKSRQKRCAMNGIPADRDAPEGNQRKIDSRQKNHRSRDHGGDEQVQR
jgi:hypothetical protein